MITSQKFRKATFIAEIDPPRKGDRLAARLTASTKSTKKKMVRFEDYWLEEWITIETTDRSRNRALTANLTSTE